MRDVLNGKHASFSVFFICEATSVYRIDLSASPYIDKIYLTGGETPSLQIQEVLFSNPSLPAEVAKHHFLTKASLREGGGIRGLPRMTEGECGTHKYAIICNCTQAPPPLLVLLEAEPPLGGSLRVQGREPENYYDPLGGSLRVQGREPEKLL